MGASMGSRVQSVLRGFTPAHLVVDGFILVRCPERLAFIGIIGFTVERLGFVGFSRVRVGSPGGGGGGGESGSHWFTRSRLGFIGSFGFTWVHSVACSCRRINSRSIGCTRAHLAVVAFIPVCVGSLERTYGSLDSLVFVCVQYCTPSGYLVHSGSRGFTRARQCVVGVIRVHVGSLGQH